MTNKKDKPYWRTSLECYLFISLIMLLFLAAILVSGQLTGTDWIGYIIKLVNEF